MNRISQCFRALSFILVFLQEVVTGEQDLTKCSKKAYEATLKKYHGWMVQSIFSVWFAEILVEFFHRIKCNLQAITARFESYV